MSDEDEEEDEQDAEAKPLVGLEDANYYDEADHTDDWITGENEPDSWVSYDDCTIERETVNVQPSEVSGESPTGHVKTSAATGVGLQELLQLIDDKLRPRAIEKEEEERSIFHRKWRPPHTEDNEIAVER